jgi:exonuclease VII small subunit
MMDPTELWRQWYETSTKMWTGAFQAGRGNSMDPYGLYQQWFNGMEDFQQQMLGAMGWPTPSSANGSLTASGGPTSAANPATEPAAQNPAAALKPASDAAAGQAAEAQNLWNQWFEAAQESWQKSLALGQEAVELTPRWIATLDQIRNNLFSAAGYPTDPLQFSTRLYNATSGPLSDFVGDLIEREDILDVSSQFLQSYASFYKVFQRNSEEYLKNLSLPVRSDITRVAGLVLALEDKIDYLEEAFEDFEDGQAASDTAGSLASVEERIAGIENKLQSITASSDASPEAATADSVSELQKRLGDVEGKIDQLLAALENTTSSGIVQAEASQQEAGTAQEDGSEINATTAAQRKARELDVDLSDVVGTGQGGQITVDDVRRKGAS